MPDRRAILIGTTAVVSLAVGGVAVRRAAAPDSAPGAFPVTLTEAEWHVRPAGAEYAVLRQSATEEPFSSPLDALYEPGVYACAGCGNEVYSSEHKFDSSTGWPPFWQALAGDVVGLRPDPKLFGLAMEAHCARHGGRPGHVFGDSPPPTGLRHSINGAPVQIAASA